MKKNRKIISIRNFIIVVTIVFSVVSCKEIIEIDLNTLNPEIVIEGDIKLDSVAVVRLSYTSDYFGNNGADYIVKSTVVLIDDLGNIDTLSYVGDGYYKGENIKGELNRSYTLSFTEGDKIFMATSILNSPAIIENVSYFESDFVKPGTEETVYAFNLKLEDSGKESYYLIKIWINNVLENDGYMLVNCSDNSNVGFTDFSYLGVELHEGDSVVLNVYSIDEPVFTFYNQLNDQLVKSMGGSTPYNPQSNFGPAVLGCFSACSCVSYSGVVE